MFVGKRNVKPACVFCNKTNHSSHKCRIVLKPQARKDIVMQKKLCFLCLKPNHSAKNCDKNFTCSRCKGKHMSVFVLIPLKKMVKIIIAKVMKTMKGLILMMTKRKLKIKLKRMIKMF